MVTDYRKEKKKCVMLLGSLVTVCFIRKEHPNTIPWRKVQSEPLLYIFTVLKLGINSHWCCNVEMCLYSKGGKIQSVFLSPSQCLSAPTLIFKYYLFSI